MISKILWLKQNISNIQHLLVLDLIATRHRNMALCYLLWNFYPRDAMLARVIEIATCLS